MTVRELIKTLKEFPQGKKVALAIWDEWEDESMAEDLEMVTTYRWSDKVLLQGFVKHD